MKSKLALFTFLMHIPGLIVLDSSVLFQIFQKQIVCLYNLHQNVMTWSAPETTFHFAEIQSQMNVKTDIISIKNNLILVFA